VYNSELFYELININNGKTDCFTSTYDFEKTIIENDRETIDPTTIKIPHLLFDLDSNNCFEDTIKIHNYCKENTLSHIIIFSGRGFHVYILVKYNALNTILDVLHYQNRIINVLSIDVDHTCLGNPRHLTRIPGTYNLKRGRWAISLREKELTSYEEIRKLAEKQRTKIYTIKGNKLELPHQKSSDIFTKTPVFAEKSIVDIDVDVFLLIPCLRVNVLPKGHLYHMERVYITQYLSEVYRMGTSISQLTEEDKKELIEKIVRFFEPILMDFDEKITREQVEKIVRKYELSPSCKKLKALGYCIGEEKCWRRKNVN
jgi:hypothetical protein